jgi:hypothetical protein
MFLYDVITVNAFLAASILAQGCLILRGVGPVRKFSFINISFLRYDHNPCTIICIELHSLFDFVSFGMFSFCCPRLSDVNTSACIESDFHMRKVRFEAL